MKLEDIDGATKLYVIIGDPVSAVRTPGVFNEMFVRQNTNAVLVPLHVAAEHLEAVWTGLKATMGNFDTTCGSVECDTTQCTVTVHWDDSRASHNSADIDAARNLTFTTVTRL